MSEIRNSRKRVAPIIASVVGALLVAFLWVLVTAKPNTADDIELGHVPATWSIEEFPVTINDDDVKFVGKIFPNALDENCS